MPIEGTITVICDNIECNNSESFAEDEVTEYIAGQTMIGLDYEELSSSGQRLEGWLHTDDGHTLFPQFFCPDCAKKVESEEDLDIDEDDDSEKL